MGNILHLPQYNLQIINFEKIYCEKFIKSFFDYCEQYNIQNINLKNKDIKKLIYHNIIFNICEEILHNKQKEKIIVYFNTCLLPKTDLNKYIHEEELLIFFELLLRKVSKILPVKVFITSITFSYFYYSWKKNDAKGIEILYRIKAFSEKFNFERFTFQKIRMFSKKYGLTFLSNIYFNNIKSKQLLLR